MKKEDLQRYYSRFKFGEDIFHQLMPYKIREILLVSSFYDAFIFEQDGRFSEQLYGEYHQLNLSSVPRITSVPTGKEAIDIIRERKFDMVITMLHIGEVTPFEMARKMKSDFPKMPILLLLNVQADAVCINKTDPKLDAIDDVFLWSGDSKVFLAMIKFVEDLLNVEHDTRVGLVRVILLVEDSVFYYSRFLPELCSEVMGQVQLLLSEELNDIQKNYRMRTRPKILMAHDYESAVGLAEKYRDYLLCVISDIRFPKNSKLDKQAGIKLLEYLKSARFDIPVLLQSAGFEYAKTAKRFGVSYIDKNSPTVIQELSDYIHWNLGFGDFIFRDESGTEYGRATDLVEFEAMLHEIP
ncbi:response regulator, partial [bacterium]|nr:response regulator [bacterium]